MKKIILLMLALFFAKQNFAQYETIGFTYNKVITVLDFGKSEKLIKDYTAKTNEKNQKGLNVFYEPNNKKIEAKAYFFDNDDICYKVRTVYPIAHKADLIKMMDEKYEKQGDGWKKENVSFLLDDDKKLTSYGVLIAFDLSNKIYQQAIEKIIATDFKEGQSIDVYYPSDGKWYPSKIKKVNTDGTYDISYDGYSSGYDETVTGDRVRKQVSE